MEQEMGSIEAKDALLTALLTAPNPVDATKVDTYDFPIPSTIAEALSFPDAIHWKASVDSEYSSLLKNNTWVVVDKLPPGRKALPCKWVFKIKTKSDGTVERYKARLVVKGFK